MRRIRAYYNQPVNTVEIVNYKTKHILRLDCGAWERGLRTTPYSRNKMDILAVEEPLEYANLMLRGEMQGWLDALDNYEVW